MYCSIVIPLYNKADYINSAIQSILDQSHQNFEIIVIDDGSTDESVLSVKAIRDKRIRLFQQNNNGVSSARNRGIDLAQGDLVVFLDADDWFLPTFLEKIVSMATTYPDIVCFATHFKNIYNPNKSIIVWDSDNNHPIEIIDDLFYRWRFNVIFATGAVAIRRLELLQLQPCFPLNEQHAEDHDLWFKLAEKYRIAYCPEQLTAYRKNVENSLCAIEPLGKLLPAYARLEQRALKRQIPEHLRSSALKLVAYNKITLAREILAAGQRYDAFIQLIDARHGITLKRWWVTLVMCTICTPTMAKRWENWRLERVKDW